MGPEAVLCRPSFDARGVLGFFSLCWNRMPLASLVRSVLVASRKQSSERLRNLYIRQAPMPLAWRSCGGLRAMASY